MTPELHSDPKLEIAHVLTMDVVEYSTLLITEQTRIMAELTRIVKGTARFRRAEAERKLIRVPTGDGMLLVFFDDPQEQTHSPSRGLAITYVKMGRMADARRILDQLIEKSRQQYVSADSIAEICAALGDKDGAFQWLERAYREHSSSLCGVGVLRTFLPLHSDPRLASD